MLKNKCHEYCSPAKSTLDLAIVNRSNPICKSMILNKALWYPVAEIWNGGFC